MNGALRSSSNQPVIVFSINLGFLLSGVLERVKLQFLSQYAAEIRTDLQKEMEARQWLKAVCSCLSITQFVFIVSTKILIQPIRENEHLYLGSLKTVIST